MYTLAGRSRQLLVAQAVAGSSCRKQLPATVAFAPLNLARALALSFLLSTTTTTIFELHNFFLEVTLTDDGESSRSADPVVMVFCACFLHFSRF